MDYDFNPHRGVIQSNCIDIDFWFTANGASNPTVVGGIGDGATGLPNFLITSIVYAATGQFTVTMSSRCKVPEVVGHFADVTDIATEDGARASIGNFSNEGTSSALTFQVNTWTAGGAAVELTDRKVRVHLRIRNSQSSRGP